VTSTPIVNAGLVNGGRESDGGLRVRSFTSSCVNGMLAGDRAARVGARGGQRLRFDR